MPAIVPVGFMNTWDPDFRAYYNAGVAAGGTMTTQNMRAVNAFIKGCKRDASPNAGVSNWTAIKSSCLLCAWDSFVGSLIPLKGSAPTNVNFVSGDYFRTTGLKGDAATKYLNSNRGNDADPQNNFSCSVYVTQTGGAVTQFYSGSNSGSGSSQIVNDQRFRCRTTAIGGSVMSAAAGFHGVVRNGASTFGWIAPSGPSSATAASETPIVSSLYVFIRLNSGSPSGFTDARLSFYHFGESVTNSSLKARLDTLMSALT